MAFRLGHQITCNLNKNLFFRNSSANARRYRSLSRGNEARVASKENAVDAIPTRSSRARSQPRPSVTNLSLREYSTETSPNLQQQQQQPQQTKNVIATKNSFRKSATNYSLQPKNLPPMATTHIHLNNHFSPMEEVPDTRPYENRLDEVQKQASVKYEQAVRTFNVNDRGPGPSGNYRYELDAAKPKLDKGTNVYNVVAAIKSREQSIAAQAPQLQPRNIKPYGDIMTKPWCSPVIERIKHKPLSINRLEEAIHKSIVMRQASGKPPAMDGPKEGPPPDVPNSPSSVQSEEVVRASLTAPKPIDQVMRKGYSTKCLPRVPKSRSPNREESTKVVEEYTRNDAEHTEINEHKPVNLQYNPFSDKATVPNLMTKTCEVTPTEVERTAPEGSALRYNPVISNRTLGRVLLYKDKMGLKKNHPADQNSRPQPENAEPIKIKLGPTQKLQSCNLVENAEDEVSLTPALGEKFVVPWLSWGDRVKLKQEKKQSLDKSRTSQLNVTVAPLIRTDEKKPQSISKIQVRRYSCGRSTDLIGASEKEVEASSIQKDHDSTVAPLVRTGEKTPSDIHARPYSCARPTDPDDVIEKEVEVERSLTPSTHNDFVPVIDFPYGRPKRIYAMSVRSYSTGIPDECFCDAPKKPEPQTRGYDPMCDPTHFPPTQVNPDCTKQSVHGPEYTVMVKLRRLPKIKYIDPQRKCPEPCEDVVRYDDGLKVERKELPKLVVKPCPPVPCITMTDVPLRRLKKRPSPEFVRICPPPPCRDPRADDGMKITPRVLPKLVPKMCGRCEEIIMTSPPLHRLKPKPAPPPKPCQPPCCPEPPTCRADAGLIITRRCLPVLVPPCCPRVCEDNLVDGPPLKRLKCYCVSEPERVCPCIPTVRDPCCPPRADEICNYTVQKKDLPTMILSARYNDISTADFARLKREKERRMHFSTYTRKCDMCCYSDKKIQPDLQAMKREIRPAEWEDFKGYLAAGRDGTIEAYDTSCEVVDKSMGTEMRVITKPIDGLFMRRNDEVQNRLLKGGYFADFGDIATRSYRTECEMPPVDKKIPKFPKLERLKKREGFDEDFPRDVPWNLRDKNCELRNTCQQIVDPPPRMDDVLNYQVKCKALPAIPKGDLEKEDTCPAKEVVALARPKKRFHYGDEPRKSPVDTSLFYTPRADDNLPPKEMKLPPVPMSMCPPIDKTAKLAMRDCKKLPRLNLEMEDPPRVALPSSKPPDCVRADDGKDIFVKKTLPILKPTCGPPRPFQPERYREGKPLKRLPPHPFMEREPCPPESECSEETRADYSLKEVEKTLPPLLKNDGKLLQFPSPPPCPPESMIKRKFSTLSSNFSYSENFTQFERSCRHLSRTSIFRSKDVDVKDEKKDSKICPKFTLPNCKAGQDPPTCDRDSIYPECKKQEPPYPAFSECKDDDPYLGLTECPPNNKYLQPKFPLIGEFIILKPPPPAQKKIDPKLEEDCVIRKLNLKRGDDVGTTTCTDFNRPYVPLRARDLIKSAMKQATVIQAEEECKKGTQTSKRSQGKDCPEIDGSTCVPGDVECELIGKEMMPMICAESRLAGRERRKVKEGELICKGIIKDCAPRPPAKGVVTKVPCQPYRPKPSPTKRVLCKKPMLCEPMPPNDTKKKEGKKAAITAKINRPIKGGNGGTNSAGGGQIRNVGGGGGGAGISKGPGEGEKQGKGGDGQGSDKIKDKCLEVCARAKQKEEAYAEKRSAKGKAEKIDAKSAAVEDSKSAKCSKTKPCPKSEGPPKKKEASAKKHATKCVVTRTKCAPSKKAKSKKTCADLLKAYDAKKGKKDAKKMPTTKSREPKKATARDRKSIAIKCSPLKQAMTPAPRKPRCPVQPAPIVSAICPKRSLWDRILEFFRARPNCPAPDQWKKDKLKREAERAAAAAGYELCEKKKIFVCAVKSPKSFKEPPKGSVPCPFPPPPPPPKGAAAAPGKKPEKPSATCTLKPCPPRGGKKAGEEKKDKVIQPDFKCKPRTKGSKKPPKGDGKCTFTKGAANEGQSNRKSSSGGNGNSPPKTKVGCSSPQTTISSSSPVLETSQSCPTKEFPYCGAFSKLPISDCVFTKGKADINTSPKQTRLFSTSHVRHFSAPGDKECKKISQAPQSACRLPKPKNCGPNPRGFDCTIKAPYPPCSPIEAPYPCFSECQKECCKAPRTECVEQTRIFQKQKALGLLDMNKMRDKDKKRYSTGRSVHQHPSYVLKRDFSTVGIDRLPRKVHSSHITPLNFTPKWKRSDFARCTKPYGPDVPSTRSMSKNTKENDQKKPGEEARVPCDTRFDITPKQLALETVQRFFCVSQNSTPVLATNELLDDNWPKLFGAFRPAEKITIPALSVKVSNDLKASTECRKAPFKRNDGQPPQNRTYATKRRLRAYAVDGSRIFKRKTEFDLTPLQRVDKGYVTNVRFYSDEGELPSSRKPKDCPKLRADVKDKCKLPRPPNCPPNPRGFDCSIRTEYPACVPQQAPYPSFSECQKECCKRQENECTEQDRIHEKQKMSGQLDICNMQKQPPKDYRFHPPSETDSSCKKNYSTFTKYRQFSRFVGDSLQAVSEEPVVGIENQMFASLANNKDNIVTSSAEKLRRTAYHVLCSDLENLSDREFRNAFMAASKSTSPRNTCSESSLLKTELKESFLADTIKRFYQSMLTMPELSIMANKVGVLNANEVQPGAIMFPACSKIIGAPAATFARVYSTLPQSRPYSSPKDCGIKEEHKKGPCEKLGQQPCCEPQHRDTCEIRTPYPQCTPQEAPYKCFSDYHKGFPRLPVCECTEQEKVYVRMKNAGAYNLKTKKPSTNSFNPNCGVNVKNDNKKYCTCADVAFVDPKVQCSDKLRDIDDDIVEGGNLTIQADMGTSAVGSAKIEVDGNSGITMESQNASEIDEQVPSPAAGWGGKANRAEDSYVSEIARRISDVSVVGRTILSRCLQRTGIFARTPQVNLLCIPSRTYSSDVGGGMSDNYRKTDDCKITKDEEKNKCKLPPQPCCEPKYRETCETDKTYPQCSPIDAPYASFSDCHRPFSMIPTSECSEQEKIFTRLRASGAYEIKRLQKVKKHPTSAACSTNQKRHFSSCPKNGDSQQMPLKELSEDGLKEMEEKQLAKKVLTTVKNGMEAIAVSTNDVEAQEAYFQLYEQLEKLCEQELHNSMHITDDLDAQQPICSRDIFSDSCLNKITVPSMADENLKQMMTIDAIKSFCRSMFAIPIMSTTLYEESEKYKTERLQKQLDELLDQYMEQKI